MYWPHLNVTGQGGRRTLCAAPCNRLFDSLLSTRQIDLPQPRFSTHDENNKDVCRFQSIEYSTGRNDNMSIGQVGNFGNHRSGFWKSDQSLHGGENLPYVPSGGIRFV